MSFGVYFHIPYCLQRCTYCDFATYEQSQILPPENYVELVKQEMRLRLPLIQSQPVDTVYFGGGTPSLISASLIVDLLEELEKLGLKIRPGSEKTIEINPATLDHKKMETYLKSGINRFSVGAQTFDDALLKMVHREHNAKQTRETLTFLKNFGVNYSFDLLFALPGQTMDILKKDLDEVLNFDPPHISPYCLTVPEGHVLSRNRPLEEQQIEMFELIAETLKTAGYGRYEISNFAKPGKESKHNSLYWDDSEYLGLGLSSHSFLKGGSSFGPYGTRFWNHNSIAAYEKHLAKLQQESHSGILSTLEREQYEVLETHQALTDFCHTALRTQQGLNYNKLREKFGSRVTALVSPALEELVTRQWLEKTITAGEATWSLTAEGLVISNQVFAALTYLKDEIKPS